MTFAMTSAGKTVMSGAPPASEMMSSRAITAIRSRIAELFITFVRDEKRAA